MIHFGTNWLFYEVYCGQISLLHSVGFQMRTISCLNSEVLLHYQYYQLTCSLKRYQGFSLVLGKDETSEQVLEGVWSLNSDLSLQAGLQTLSFCFLHFLCSLAACYFLNHQLQGLSESPFIYLCIIMHCFVLACLKSLLDVCSNFMSFFHSVY